MMTIAYILSFILFAFSAVSLTRLYLMLIQPNHFLFFIQKWIFYFENRNDFMYRSLGGCSICVMQRITELTYVGFMFIFPGTFLFKFLMFIIYSGIVHGICNMTMPKHQPPTKTQKIEL